MWVQASTQFQMTGHHSRAICWLLSSPNFLARKNWSKITSKIRLLAIFSSEFWQTDFSWRLPFHALVVCSSKIRKYLWYLFCSPTKFICVFQIQIQSHRKWLWFPLSIESSVYFFSLSKISQLWEFLKCIRDVTTARHFCVGSCSVLIWFFSILCRSKVAKMAMAQREQQVKFHFTFSAWSDLRR